MTLKNSGDSTTTSVVDMVMFLLVHAQWEVLIEERRLHRGNSMGTVRLEYWTRADSLNQACLDTSPGFSPY